MEASPPNPAPRGGFPRSPPRKLRRQGSRGRAGAGDWLLRGGTGCATAGGTPSRVAAPPPPPAYISGRDRWFPCPLPLSSSRSPSSTHLQLTSGALLAGSDQDWSGGEDLIITGGLGGGGWREEATEGGGESLATLQGCLGSLGSVSKLWVALEGTLTSPFPLSRIPAAPHPQSVCGCFQF